MTWEEVSSLVGVIMRADDRVGLERGGRRLRVRRHDQDCAAWLVVEIIVGRDGELDLARAARALATSAFGSLAFWQGQVLLQHAMPPSATEQEVEQVMAELVRQADRLAARRHAQHTIAALVHFAS